MTKTTTTITRTNVNNNNNNQGVSRNRRRRGRVVVVQQQVQPSGRTLRNRRRRARNRVRGMLPLAATRPIANSYFSRYFSGPYDPTMLSSVHKLVQSQFYPQHGVFRGISNGLEMTGITTYQGSLEISTSASFPVVTFEMIPALFARTAVTTSANFFNWIAATSITDPQQATLTGAVSGPFALNNPAISGRIVSATLNLIPASTVLNRGGEGKLFYASNSNSLSWTRSDVDNLSISRAWDGVDAMTLHWTPGNIEYDFTDGVNNNPEFSSLGGYIVLPQGTVNTWRVEWQVGIEYIPNSGYRPLIDRKTAKIRPDARYFLNEIVQDYWTPLMISTLKDYMKRVSLGATLGGHLPVQHMSHAGLGGMGFVGANAPEQAEVYEEEQEDGFMSVMSRAASSAGRTLCNVAEGIYGEDICDNPGRFIGGQLAHQFGRRNGRQYFPSIAA